MIEDEIRELFDKISAQMRQDYNHLLHEVNLHVGQDNLLCRLWTKDGATQVQLCEQLKCEPPTVTNMVTALEQQDKLLAGIVPEKRLLLKRLMKQMEENLL